MEVDDSIEGDTLPAVHCHSELPLRRPSRVLLQAQILREFGGTVLANACGPCIGQWKRLVIHLLQLFVAISPTAVHILLTAKYSMANFFRYINMICA